jgi:hypothetical protein
MAVDNIKLAFDPQFVGTMTSPSGTIKLGDQEGGMAPYHLLFGAVGRFSSAGRAPAPQAGGRRFEPANLHHAEIAQLVEQLTCNQ